MPPTAHPTDGSDRPAASRRRIAVVGGGAAGMLVAIGVLRSGVPVDVLLLDPSGTFGPGVAYATRDPLHRLNVPAGKLSIDPARPDGFVDWLQRFRPDATAASFRPRGDYGDYLRDSLDAAERAAAEHGSRLTRLAVAAADVVAGAHGERVELADGGALHVDQVVLAIGPNADTPVVPFEPGRELWTSPWQVGALGPLPPRSHVVLVGSGLTAVDAALRLCADHADATVTMVSRSARLPAAHLPAAHGPHDTTPTADEPLSFTARPRTAEALVHAIEQHVAAGEARGIDWRATIDSLRPITTELWQSLPVAEQRELLQRHGRRWDLHRHRMAPEVAARMHELVADGRVRLLAGQVERAAGTSRGPAVWLHGSPEPIAADRVVACTGPSNDVRRHGPAIVRRLLASGRASADALGIGIRSSPDGRLVDAAGRPEPRIHVVGAQRRGELFESTAVPELRDQAAVVAAAVIAPILRERDMLG